MNDKFETQFLDELNNQNETSGKATTTLEGESYSIVERWRKNRTVKKTVLELLRIADARLAHLQQQRKTTST